MPMIPKPTQISGAAFLADRSRALLADEPRVGKTGAAIMAADDLLLQNIIVVTTASGRAIWKKAFADWSSLGRPVTTLIALREQKVPDGGVVIIGWGGATKLDVRARLVRRRWDLLILDESHYAKSFSADRTCAVYGTPRKDGAILDQKTALAAYADRVWCLSGTPIPNTQADLYPMLRGLWPERLTTEFGETDVTVQETFLDRYCKRKPMRFGRGWAGVTTWVVIGSKNEEELRRRLDGLTLRRTQQDVGITAPIYETMPIRCVSFEIERNVKAKAKDILEAAEEGRTKDLEIAMASVRRLTGVLKCKGVAEAVQDAFDTNEFGKGGKIVLMAFHTEVIDKLTDLLRWHKPLVIDGRTGPVERAENERLFREEPMYRVMIAQLQAAGEAVDFSAAADLWFVESSFVPKDMKQAALRITNHTQTKQPRVRVCVAEGTIDEALQTVLLRKWSVINEVLTK